MDEEKMIKYCRTASTRNWYVFGFVFKPEEYLNWNNRACIMCYDHKHIFKKRNDMIVVEAPESVKNLLFSKDPKSRTVGKSILDAAAKKEKTKIIYAEI